MITTIIALCSLTIAFFTLRLNALLSNTRKYEMQRNYYCEVLHWYSETNSVLCELKHLLLHDPEQFRNAKSKLLARLSAQIDIGRFYFPNKRDGYGDNKPLAYRGLRNIILDYLVFSYQLYAQNEVESIKTEYIEKLQREYTSEIFEILCPQDIIKHLNTLTDNSYYREWTIEDVLKSKDPEFIRRVLADQ